MTRCRIAVLGFGTVGSAVVRRLVADRLDFHLTHILDRRAAEKRATLHTPQVVWTTRIQDVLDSDADVVAEAIGGVEPAAQWIRAALLAGKSVVTANKQVIARDGDALLRLAARQGRQLRFEAAVGGAMPIVRAIGDGLSGDRITRIVAILNGTTNAVLSRMEATGCSMPEALADAQARGFAEADPSADLDGDDAAAKLAILSALAFAVRIAPSRIAKRTCATIDQRALARVGASGGTIRQLAHAAFDRSTAALTVWVAPAVVPCGSIFGRTIGPRNAAVISGEYSGATGLSGLGAGGDATAVAILGDLTAIARDRAAIVPAPNLSFPRTIVGFNTSDAEHEHGLAPDALCVSGVDRPVPAEAM